MGPRFQDRFDAGGFLARRLLHYANDPAVVVLALPRGGVPVAYEVARELNAPLDIFVVRKLGVPGFEELAMGAIASGGIRVLNEELVHRLSIPARVIEAPRRPNGRSWSGARKPFAASARSVPIAGRKVILVDDGLATGASMRAAVQALRQQNPTRIIVAVPIGARETCEHFRSEVDEVICGETPEPFFAIGTWYSNFLQTTDEEVRELLDRAAHERRQRAQKQRAFAE